MNGMNDWMAAVAAQPWELVWRLIAAALLGGLVGLERESTNHAAGLRTNMLVALGSCLFTILSIYGFPTSDQGGASGQNAMRDPARLAAQIVSGIGFLGAGAVLHHRGGVRGLTTAASIWLVAAIGMAAGTGSYFLAVLSTVVALVVLVGLRPLSALLSPDGNKPKREGAPPDDDDGEPAVTQRRLPR
jgi:putative Mg2+ transporter-C (MgtC) family protein